MLFAGLAATSTVGQCFGCSDLARCSQCGHSGVVQHSHRQSNGRLSLLCLNGYSFGLLSCFFGVASFLMAYFLLSWVAIFFYSKWETLQAPQNLSSAQQDVSVAKQATLVALCWPTSTVGQCFGCSDFARCSQCGHRGVVQHSHRQSNGRHMPVLAHMLDASCGLLALVSHGRV